MLIRKRYFDTETITNQPSKAYIPDIHPSRGKYNLNVFDKRETTHPAGIYLPKVNNRNTRTRCEISSKLTIKTLNRRQWRRSSVFMVNFGHISHLLVFLLLTLSR